MSKYFVSGSHDDTFLKEVVTSDFQADKVSFFVLDLDVVPVMSPQFNVLVYHILPDGEVVADGRDFSVQPCFENQVTVFIGISCPAQCKRFQCGALFLEPALLASRLLQHLVYNMAQMENIKIVINILGHFR